MPSSTFNFLAKDGVLVPAGAFNRRVSFLTQSVTADDIGTPVITWVTDFSTWAHMEPWKGREYVADNQVFAQMWTRVLLRYRPSQPVNGTMRMQYGIKVYRIRDAFLPAEANKIVELLCEEIQSTGSAH
jgi:SPP1 family predicted phage head-tail adaptor